ncbi:MAG: hypothetical protein QXR65_08630 [Candidatus Bathyarchaeia archaeon]
MDLPDYKGLERCRRRYIKRILRILLEEGGELRFSDFQAELGLSASEKSTLHNNLDSLRSLGFVTGDKRGPIRLKWRTPLCFIAGTPNIPYAYLGLLGVKDEREVSETETAVRILESSGIAFERIVVVTTQEAVGSWSNSMDPELASKIEWHTLRREELNRIESVRDKVKPKLLELMREFTVVMDCTSGTRPAGIAFYNLAIQHMVPLIYVYEPEKELIWLISREDLERDLRYLFKSEPTRASPS